MAKKGKKRKSAEMVDQSDQDGSRAGKESNSARDSMKPSFHIRLTYKKVEDQEVDHWISGSTETEPDLIEVLKTKFPMGRVSLERGEKGLEHFQATVLTGQTRQRCSAVQKYLIEHFPELYFADKRDYCEPCRKTWASVEYCKKEETHVAGPWEWGLEKTVTRDLTLKDLPDPYPFQQTILDRYEEPAPLFNSKIHWYVDPAGQIGKTMTGRMLTLTHDFYLLDGDAQKQKFQCAKNPKPGYILNIVRSKEGRFSYAGLEAISDQYFCDTFGSDQQGMIIRKGAHIVCFANWLPQLDQITPERWVIYKWDEEVKDFLEI